MEEIKKLEEGYNKLDIDLNEKKVENINNQIKNPASDAEEIDFVEISSTEMEDLVSIHFNKLKESIKK